MAPFFMAMDGRMSRVYGCTGATDGHGWPNVTGAWMHRRD